MRGELPCHRLCNPASWTRILPAPTRHSSWACRSARASSTTVLGSPPARWPATASCAAPRGGAITLLRI